MGLFIQERQIAKQDAAHAHERMAGGEGFEVVARYDVSGVDAFGEPFVPCLIPILKEVGSGIVPIPRINQTVARPADDPFGNEVDR